MDAAVGRLSPWQGADLGPPTDALVSQLDIADPAETNVSLITGPDKPLQAVTIERLPPWAKDHRQDGEDVGRRYGDHLGVGVYVWDGETESWYRRARHGRGMCTAASMPFKRVETAGKLVTKLERQLLDGSYSAAREARNGYSKRLLRLNQRLEEDATEEGYLLEAERKAEEQEEEARRYERLLKSSPVKVPSSPQAPSLITQRFDEVFGAASVTRTPSSTSQREPEYGLCGITPTDVERMTVSLAERADELGHSEEALDAVVPHELSPRAMRVIAATVDRILNGSTDAEADQRDDAITEAIEKHLDALLDDLSLV